jgi:iron complex transport system ATP-binding protein
VAAAEKAASVCVRRPTVLPHGSATLPAQEPSAASLLSGTALCVQGADGHTLLAYVDLALHAGEVLGVVGPNGAGKSTLLKVLAGVRGADSGSVALLGKPFAQCPPAQRARALAYLEQRPVVHWPLTVLQVVTLGRLPHGQPDGRAAQEAIRAALASTATTALQQRAFQTLSEGEKMRVNLARVLATCPRLILADEPTAALDPWHQLQVLELLRALAGEGLGILLVLHDLGLAARFCDRLLLLDAGRVIGCGSPQDVLTPANLAHTWRIDAELAPDSLNLVTRGRLPT